MNSCPTRCRGVRCLYAAFAISRGDAGGGEALVRTAIEASPCRADEGWRRRLQEGAEGGAQREPDPQPDDSSREHHRGALPHHSSSTARRPPIRHITAEKGVALSGELVRFGTAGLLTYPGCSASGGHRSRVAQSAERPAVNRQVIGSSPIAGAEPTADLLLRGIGSSCVGFRCWGVTEVSRPMSEQFGANELQDALRDAIESSPGEVAYGLGRIESARVADRKLLQGMYNPIAVATGEYVSVSARPESGYVVIDRVGPA